MSRSHARLGPRQSTIAMMAGASDDHVDAFEVQVALKIDNPKLGVSATIQPEFVKEREDRKFVLLDFYQSRGVYTLLCSRLPSMPSNGRPYAKLLSQVLGNLKSQRDEAWRESLCSDGSKVSFYKNRSVVMPKRRHHQAIALAKSEIFEFEVEAIPGMCDGRLACIMPLQRKNRHSELWVAADSWNVLSKVVAHEHRKSLQDEDEAHATATNNETANWLEVEMEASTLHTPKRQPPGDGPATVEGQSPTKRQTTLHAFMKSAE